MAKVLCGGRGWWGVPVRAAWWSLRWRSISRALPAAAFCWRLRPPTAASKCPLGWYLLLFLWQGLVMVSQLGHWWQSITATCRVRHGKYPNVVNWLGARQAQAEYGSEQLDVDSDWRV